jgi:hypothetical protein
MLLHAHYAGNGTGTREGFFQYGTSNSPGKTTSTRQDSPAVPWPVDYERRAGHSLPRMRIGALAKIGRNVKTSSRSHERWAVICRSSVGVNAGTNRAGDA